MTLIFVEHRIVKCPALMLILISIVSSNSDETLESIVVLNGALKGPRTLQTQGIKSRPVSFQKTKQFGPGKTSP